MTSVSQTTLRELFDLDQFYSYEDLNKLFDLVEANMNRLGLQIDQDRIGQAIFSYDSPIASDVKVGQPVYWNLANGQFEQSKLGVLESGGWVYASESSEAWGIVERKCSSDRAHVLLSGLATINLYESTGEASPSGKFYLSQTAGALKTEKDFSVVVPCLMATGNGEVLFRPWYADTFPRYVPKLVDLITSPAGSTTTSGGRVTITGPNSSMQGWLPASHETFGGVAPIGASFGYNKAQDTLLATAWPPLDPSNSRVFYEAGGTESQGARVLLGNDAERLLVNDEGIWWMDNCEGQLPWDFAIEGVSTGDCPHPYERKMTLEADFGVHGGDLPANVTSLKSQLPWLQFYKEGTSNLASIGNLELGLDLDQLFKTQDSFDPVAMKSFEDGQFVGGPVVSGVRSDSPSLQIVGGLSKAGYRYGQLTLSVTTSKDSDLLPNDTQLFGATVEKYAETMAIGLPSGRETSFVSSYHVPAAIPAESNIRFVLWIVAQTQFSLPMGLTATTRRYTQPAIDEDLPLPEEVALTIDYTVGRTIEAGNVIRIETDLVEVAGGDQIYLRLRRAGDDGESAEVHYLHTYARFENA